MKTLTPRALLSLVLLVSIVLQSLGQEWTLGKYQFITDRSENAIEKRSLAFFSEFGTYKTHSVMGGIIFDRIAMFEESISKVRIAYDIRAADGSRLVITINDTTEFRPIAFDWQLIPTAYFADDKNNSLITIKEDYVSYHSAILDQLMGIRALQADKLANMSLHCGDCNVEFMRANGVEIKGKGEASLPEHLKERSIIQSNRFGQLLAENGGYATYKILTDHRVAINALIRNNQFILEGDPYISMVYVDHDARLATVRWPDISDASQRQLSADYFKNINPYLFQSMKFVSNYSALFRYIKNNSNGNWKEFMSTIGDLKSTKPRVKTPNIQSYR